MALQKSISKMSLSPISAQGIKHWFNPYYSCTCFSWLLYPNCHPKKQFSQTELCWIPKKGKSALAKERKTEQERQQLFFVFLFFSSK